MNFGAGFTILHKKQNTQKNIRTDLIRNQTFINFFSNPIPVKNKKYTHLFQE